MDVLKKVPVREQDAQARGKNFEEVCLGYNREEAMEEAARCINCKNAQCVKGCPVAINIPGFVEQVKNGDMEGAYQTISPRRASVRANASGASRESRYPSENWSALWQITPGSRA